MKRYAILDEDGNILNTIIYDGVAKYEIGDKKFLKDIMHEKFKYAEKEDKIKSDTLEKKVKDIVADIVDIIK